MKVDGLAQEVGTEALVRVVQDFVLVGVAESGGILDAELDVPDELATLGALGGGDLLGLAVVHLDGLADIAGLDAGHAEAGSEGLAGELSAEELIEGGGAEIGPLAVNVRDGDGHGWDGLSELGLVGGGVVLNLGDGGGEAGGADEGHDVGVVGEGEHLLGRGGLVNGGRSDSDSLADLQVRELQLEGQSVPGGARGVSQLELVGVGVHLVDLADSGDDVEVGLLGLGALQGSVHVLGENVALLEVGGGPLSEGGEDGGVLLLDGGSVAGVLGWLEVAAGGADDWLLVGGEEGEGAVPVHGDVELTAVVVHAEGGSVETDDVTETEADGEVLEALGVHDNGGVVAALGAGGKAWVDNLEGADVELLVLLVGEGCVDDDTVDVLGLNGAEGGLAEVNVLVLGTTLGLLGGGLGGSLSSLGRSWSWHCDKVFLSC